MQIRVAGSVSFPGAHLHQKKVSSVSAQAWASPYKEQDGKCEDTALLFTNTQHQYAAKFYINYLLIPSFHFLWLFLFF